MASARRQTLDILWVEDDNDLVAAAREFFDPRGSRVHEVLPWHMHLHHAASMAEARRLLSAAPPDLVVADLHLPDSRGSDTLAALRRLLPGVPLVALTGDPDPVLGLLTGTYEAEFLAKDQLTRDALWRAMFAALARPHDLPSARKLPGGRAP